MGFKKKKLEVEIFLPHLTSKDRVFRLVTLLKIKHRDFKDFGSYSTFKHKYLGQ